MSFSLRDRLSVLAALLLSVAATPCASSAGGLCFQTTPWEACTDYPDLECREVTVPRFYEPTTVVQGNAEGTLTNLERRVVSGKPKKHVWLLQGGCVHRRDQGAQSTCADGEKPMYDGGYAFRHRRCADSQSLEEGLHYPGGRTKQLGVKVFHIQFSRFPRHDAVRTLKPFPTMPNIRPI